MGSEQNQMIHESTTTHVGEDPRSSDQIRSEIRRTRGRMDETLDELGDRLTLRSIVNTALDWYENRDSGSSQGIASSVISSGTVKRKVKSAATSAGKSTARTLSHTIKEHPMPSALVGAGLAWMIVEALSDDDDSIYIEEVDLEYAPVGYTSTGLVGEVDFEDTGELHSDEPGMMDKAREKAEHAKDAVTGAVGTAKDKLSDAAYAARRAKMRAAERARSGYGRGRTMGRDMSRRMHHGYESGMERMHHGYETGVERFERASHESPLAVGLGFAALGALVGLLLPRTRREDELIGERRDELVHTMKEKGEELVQKGREMGAELADTARAEAAKHGITAESLGQAASAVTSKVSDVAMKKDEPSGSSSQTFSSGTSTSQTTPKTESTRPFGQTVQEER